MQYLKERSSLVMHRALHPWPRGCKVFVPPPHEGPPDRADADHRGGPYDVAAATDPDVVVYHITGAFFFGAAAAVGAAFDRIAEHRRAYVIDFSAVPIIDRTAAATIDGFVRKAHRHGAAVYITRAQRTILLLTWPHSPSAQAAPGARCLH